MNCSAIIYIIKSPSNKIYVGQTRNLKRRLNEYNSGNIPQQPALFNSIQKYGFHRHTVKIAAELPFDISGFYLTNQEKFVYNQFMEAGYTMLNCCEPTAYGRSRRGVKRKFRLGNINSPEAIKKANETKFKNGTNRHSEAAKEKMRLRKLGRKMLPQTRKAMDEANYKPVIKMTMNGVDIEEFKSITDAAKSVNKVFSNVSACCKGRQNSCAGFKWRFK